jgi:alpha-L-rhamnosidase
MVRTVAGLDLDEAMPGYKHLVVRPQPGGGLTSARADLVTPYGSAATGWTLADGRMRVVVRVPPNATATVRLPGAKLAALSESGRPASTAAGVTAANQNGDGAVLEIGSGEYIFEYPAAPPAPTASGASNGK